MLIFINSIMIGDIIIVFGFVFFLFILIKIFVWK